MIHRIDDLVMRWEKSLLPALRPQGIQQPCPCLPKGSSEIFPGKTFVCGVDDKWRLYSPKACAVVNIGDFEGRTPAFSTAEYFCLQERIYTGIFVGFVKHRTLRRKNGQPALVISRSACSFLRYRLGQVSLRLLFPIPALVCTDCMNSAATIDVLLTINYLPFLLRIRWQFKELPLAASKITTS